MKRKTVLALFALCAVLSMSACGENTADKKAETKETESQETESQEKEEEPEEKEEKAEEKKEDASTENTRLVTVDKVEDYITLGQYKDLALERVIQPVTDADVDGRINAVLQSFKEEIADGPAQVNDQITIDFKGTKDGVAFDGGTAQDYEMVLGSGGMIEGFEDGIVGMKVGETKTLDLTFPEDYREKSLAGQPVQFEITVKRIYRAPAEIPELTDEWVAKNSKLTTVDEYRSSVRTALENEAAQSAEQELYSKAWNMLLETSEIKEYPEKDLNNALEESKRMYQDFADQAGMTLEEFVESQGYTMEDFEEQNLSYIQAKLKQNLIIQGIMDAEGLSLDDEESRALLDNMIQVYGLKDEAQLVDVYGQVAVDEAIGLVRVEKFIIDHSQIAEKAASGDLVGENANVPEEADDSEAADAQEEADTPEDADIPGETEE